MTPEQCTVVRQDALFVESRTRQGSCIGAGGHDDLFADQRIGGRSGHGDFVADIDRLHKRPTAVEVADLVLLEQVQDAVVVLLHDRILAGHHLRYVHPHVGNADAVVCEMLVRVLKMLGRLQQRLGWDAANVGTGAARSGAAGGVLPLVDAGDLQTQLCGAYGGNVAAWAAADDDDVELFAHGDVEWSVGKRPTEGLDRWSGLKGGSVGIRANQRSNSRRDGSSSASFIATRPSTASRPSMMRWSYDMAR